MSSANTPNLGLFKATPGTAERFRTADVNSNMDKIDAAIGPTSIDITPSSFNNSTGETSLFTGQVGISLQASVYRVVAVGTYGHTSSATTLTVRLKHGGTTIITYTINTPASALSGRPFRIEAELFCLTSGATGTWKMGGVMVARVNTTDTPFVESPASYVKDTTILQGFDITFQWGAANAANTVSVDSAIIHRLSNA